MNQDSDRGDNRPNDRRDGKGRSFGRRDDDRSTDRPRVNQNNNADQPRFNRDRTGRDNDRPNDNRRSDGPRNDRNTRSEAPRFNRDNQNDRPRFSRDNDRRPDRPGDRPDRSNRDDRPRNPRSERDERPRRSDESRSDRNNDAGRPRFNRDDNRSGGRSTVRPRSDQSRRDEQPPRFNRDDKPRPDRSNDRFGNDRPSRFSDRPNDRDRTDGRRDENPDSRPPRFSRDGFDKPRADRSNDRPERRERGESERDNRPSRFNRDDKPAFKRVGGFNREADERNRFGREDRTNQRSDARRSDARPSDDRRSEGGNREPRTNRDNNTDSRFSKEQRQESSDRRTGSYDKAPNYAIEQAPFKRRDRDDDSRPHGGQRRSSESGERPKRQPSDEPGLTRLNRYIANSGVCSRREADELIALGDISVNGKVVTEMGFKVKEGDTVKYGTKVLNPERFVYVLLNKPKDYITTTDDPEERRTVMELVADAGNFRMYPVGRLDRNTTGLLLLTNDGELADKLTHPSNNVRKIYQIEIDKPITNEDFEAIQRGVDLEDGPIKPDSVSIITPDAQVIGIEIHSGRNRIVRRLFESLGYEVTKLDRTTFAGLTKKDLPRGKWRFLDPKEVVKLKYFNS